MKGINKKHTQANNNKLNTIENKANNKNNNKQNKLYKANQKQ